MDDHFTTVEKALKRLDEVVKDDLENETKEVREWM